ncbi:MAG TPA: hypothetical protein DCS93_10825 [Microscillaceae bacterium]|nr:hypothetical protein [Microscillaceae bacterium]
MKKSLTKFFSLIALAGVVFFSSCGSSDDATTPNAPTISVSETGNGSYENGDQIAYTITATVPGGVKIVNFTKTVDGTESAATGITGVNPGDTTIAGTVNIPVAEDAGKTVTITVNVTDNSDQTASATATYTVVAAGQGGGGSAPLLRGTATVSLGSEGATAGSYLASSKGTAGVFLSSQAQANQADIDITFGVGNTGGPSLISPDQRTSVGLNAGSPAMTAARTTYFKAEANGPTTLSTVKAIDVENNITATTTKNLMISAGSVYSFVQAGDTGKKGYILVKSISGSGTNRTAEIEFVVQQ